MFRFLPLLLGIILSVSVGHAQNVFRIDSLPVQSIILNKGWTWHAGDNPDWAKPTFDDRQWKPINPTQDIDRLPQIKKAGIGWFRLRLKVDTSLVNQIVRLQVNQIFASEVYLNGQKIAAYGTVSLNPDSIKAYNPAGAPNATESIYVQLGPGTDQVLAVRFALEPNLIYFFTVYSNTCLQMSLSKADPVKAVSVDLAPIDYFKAGVFLILALLHFIFYFSFRTQKASLYFANTCLGFATYFLLEEMTRLHTHSVAVRLYVNIVLMFVFLIGNLLILKTIYTLFSYRNRHVYTLLAGYSVLLFIIDLLITFFGSNGFLSWYGLLVFSLPILFGIEVVRVCIITIKHKNSDARTILLGELFYMLFIGASIINSAFTYDPISKQIIGHIFYNIGTLCVPISFTIYAAREFARTGVSLQKKLDEVKQLSVEKEQILTTQNETLERQVAERTAELSHKNEELAIETALERVRSQSMAMQYSDDLLNVIQVVSAQLQGLGFAFDYVNFVVSRADRGWDSYNAVPTNDEILSITIPYVDHKLFSQGEEALQQGVDFFTYALTPEEKSEWLNYFFNYTAAKDAPAEYKQSVIDLPGMAGSVVVSIDLGFSIVNYQGVPYTDTENAIFKRFGAVFGQAYTRFKDLKKAEEQAREAVRTAALDRVRAEIASMRTTQDLERITPLIWSELTTLQVPFFRCGVFIIDEAHYHIQAFLSTPDGRSRTQLYLPIDGTENNQQLVQSWQRQKIYHDRWSHQQLQQWAASMVEEGQIDSLQEYEVVEEVQDAFSLQFIPFRQGMLYVGSQQPLTERELDLAQSLADAFSVAYARYEDFRQLEEAKARVDSTLTELKTTQNQLIQKEKLASLGELTAGIAHEIQNPLNFVNNFSELSVELISELQEERSKEHGKRDAELENELLNDLSQNQEKINHHGKRAASIVRGMLEHSRVSTGERQVTDLNVLVDEYLRLAYQGLRAKDNTFSADYELIADENLPLISVVPQEIGRVVLNLINNAFYAVHQRSASESDAYQPKVTLSTQTIGNQVVIQVRDNGGGIPPSIKDKIFQPFFTTKPTGEGTGLGLSLAYDIVTKGHEGTLTVETKEGEGTTFIVQLPA